MTVNKIVSQITDDELKLAFKELEEWKYKTGTMVDGVTRQILNRWEAATGQEEDLRVLEQAILYEIGRRIYND